MKHFKPTIAALAIAFAIPTTANAQLFGGGGLSNFGGLGNPFSAGPLGSTLTGAGAGAGIGALLAPSGRGGRGAAIGAALGGAGALALNSLNQSRRQQFSGQQFAGQSFSQPQFTGQTFAQPQFTGQTFTQQPYYTGQSVSQFIQGPTQHIVQPTRYLPDVRVQTPRIIQQAAPRTIYVAPPPPIRQRAINTNVTNIAPLPVAQAQSLSAPLVTQTITLQQPVVQRIIRQPVVTRQYIDEPVQYIDEPEPIQTVVSQPAISQPAISQPVITSQQVIAQPVQPSTLCYSGGSTRYDSWGNKIEGFSGPTCGN